MSKDLKATIVLATKEDYPLIQNLSRLYLYNISQDYSSISYPDIPLDGMYESCDFRIYFQDPTHKAFLVKVEDKIAGFVLLNQKGIEANTNWNMGEFFILGKFQAQGIGRSIAHQIWDMHPGAWEVSVFPEYGPALYFWDRAIDRYTKGEYWNQIKSIDYDTRIPSRMVFTFDTNARANKNQVNHTKINIDAPKETPLLTEIIYDLEISFLSSKAHALREQLEQILDKKFIEFSSSGQRYNKNDILNLRAHQTPPKVMISFFSVRGLSPRVELTMYITTEDDQEYLRSSIWKRVDDENWKLIFHQGTRRVVT